MDELQNFIFDDHPVRGALIRLDSVYQKILQAQSYPMPIQQLLAEALAGLLLLASVNKISGRMSLQFQGGQIIQLLSVQHTSAGFVRGLVQFDTSRKIDQQTLLQDLSAGTLSVVYQPDTTVKQYQSVVSFVGTSIVDSLQHYCGQSEQQLTKIKVAYNGKQLIGFMLQMMPEIGRQDRPAESWEHLTTLAETLTSDELLRHDNETILHRLYHQEQIRVFDPANVQFGCQGSKRRFENAILSMGLHEAESILAEHSAIDVNCEFCQKLFSFDRVDVEALFRAGQTPDCNRH